MALIVRRFLSRNDPCTLTISAQSTLRINEVTDKRKITNFVVNTPATLVISLLFFAARWRHSYKHFSVFQNYQRRLKKKTTINMFLTCVWYKNVVLSNIFSKVKEHALNDSKPIRMSCYFVGRENNSDAKKTSANRLSSSFLPLRVQ